jgi:cholesterol oxidase
MTAGGEFAIEQKDPCWSSNMSNSQDFDVIVVGSGYGGASAAESLARAGLKVGILERGTWWGAFDGHRPYPETLPQIMGALTRFNLTAFGRNLSIPLARRGLLEAGVHERTLVLNSSGVGGNSLVSGAYLQRAPQQFFDSLPPELTAAELAPHYQRIEEALQVSSGPQDACKHAVLAQLAQREHWQLGPTPQAIRWQTDDPQARPACTQCNKCMLGCNVGAKTSFDHTLIPSAIKAGAVVRDLCTVQTVTRVADGYEVRIRDERQGRDAVLRAPRVVMAAGTLNTLKILLRSTASGCLGPIPELGRHFSLASDWVACYRLPRDIDPQTVSGHVLDAQLRVPGAEIEFDHQILCATGPLFPGSWLLRKLQGRRTLTLIGFGPDDMNGVVSWKGRGILVRHSPQALVGRIQSTQDRIAQEFGWTKPVRPVDPQRRVRPWLSAHPLGGCRMATDASRGVVDFRGEVFGHPGLYVADASVFPSMSIAGPQLSVSALASWIAERIAQDAAKV